MQFKPLFALVICFTMVLSCNKKETETDNLFKFRDYISYTTTGRISVAKPITINLTKDVEGWEIDKEITKNILTIKPHLSGKLIAIVTVSLIG